MPQNLWSDDEIAALRVTYARGGVHEAQAALPGRSPKAVRTAVERYVRVQPDRGSQRTIATRRGRSALPPVHVDPVELQRRWAALSPELLLVGVARLFADPTSVTRAKLFAPESSSRADRA